MANRRRVARGTWLRGALAVGLGLMACTAEDSAPAAPAPDDPTPSRFVGREACSECHAEAEAAWTGSHHDLAMQEPHPDSVLGDFDDAEFQHGDAHWRFFRRGDRFFVRTEDTGGEPTDFAIAYVFGVAPLQQYLVALDNGRLQALTTAWDARPVAAGGQRWFSLHADASPPPGDVLHWTGHGNRWNSMCADCHSTQLEKRYDADQQRYATTWAELDVACEACHGPGSRHVEWARAGGTGRAGSALVISLAHTTRWRMDPATGIARRQPGTPMSRELETCAPCHSRRSQIHEGALDTPYLDRYAPALLDEGLYFPDGQIQDEVYVYGSFLQSRMARAGVTCSDCHEPHSLSLRADGDALCGQCHAPERFARTEHHHHAVDSEGARCVGCHMPSRTYMRIDDRRDHSFRIPRPDVSVELGTPNPCTACHADRDAAWAAAQVEGWGVSLEAPRAARALATGRAGDASAEPGLLALARAEEEAPITRATAITLLTQFPSSEATATLGHAARHPDGLLRLAAARAAAGLAPGARSAVIAGLLDDPLRAVRLEAARALAEVPSVPAAFREARFRALAEYERAQRLHLDEPSAHVNLGLLALAQDRADEALRHYERARATGPYFLPAAVNLADLYRLRGRDAEGEALLRDAVALAPESADVQHAFGLALVRSGKREAALTPLAKAAQLAPESARFAYVHGVALHSSGQPEQALEVLAAAQARHPRDRSLLEALASMHRDQGNPAEAQRYLDALRALDSQPSR